MLTPEQPLALTHLDVVVLGPRDHQILTVGSWLIHGQTHHRTQMTDEFSCGCKSDSKENKTPLCQRRNVNKYRRKAAPEMQRRLFISFHHHHTHAHAHAHTAGWLQRWAFINSQRALCTWKWKRRKEESGEGIQARQTRFTFKISSTQIQVYIYFSQKAENMDSL